MEGPYKVTLHHAGHVAGAVSVEIKTPKERILFTGDILFDGQRTLDGAQPLMEKCRYSRN
jgi:Cft2 family RNA processing exonuclease